ncbi:DUF3034 family protein [Erythrobacter neustonensis]|uniref:DUF3034 family protein n=1 Tax=Erythrobacter neustonensis TaxID=1112 RepID=UPI000A6651A5|nr:DUF3034 family protein [Erythrobacter neustonensis]
MQSLASLMALTAAAAAPEPAPHIAYAPVLDANDVAGSPAIPPVPLPLDAAPTQRALAPLGEVTALGNEGVRIGKVDVLAGGKLLLTNGVTTVEGSSGGGLARWATIGGRQMAGGVGLSAHATAIELPDFGWRSYGVLLGLGDRLELSIARADFDTRDVGALLGIGQGYTFNLDTFGAKLRVAGDVVYGDTWLPQIAIGAEHKRSRDGALVRALGASEASGTDYTLSATKLLLAQSLLINGTLRYTKANELGQLGFGSANAGYHVQFEGSLGYQLSRRGVIGVEYRTKPDNLGLGDDDWMDLFATYALTDQLTLTAAYVDLGSIATVSDQRGGFLSAQVAF